MKPLARPGKYDADILIQHKALLEQLITSKLGDLSKEGECVYSLKKQEPSHWFIGANEGTIMMRRCPERRDKTEIVVERLENGKEIEDSFIITITPGGNVHTWDHMETYYRCKRWSEFFTPIVKEWLSVISTEAAPPPPAHEASRDAANKEVYDFLATANFDMGSEKPDKKKEKVPLPGQKSIMSFFGGTKPKPAEAAGAGTGLRSA
jgi:hypothetical protein